MLTQLKYESPKRLNMCKAHTLLVTAYGTLARDAGRMSVANRVRITNWNYARIRAKVGTVAKQMKDLLNTHLEHRQYPSLTTSRFLLNQLANELQDDAAGLFQRGGRDAAHVILVRVPPVAIFEIGDEVEHIHPGIEKGDMVIQV